MSCWYVYLIRTASGALYTGITTDVERRFAEHQAGAPKGARSLRGKGPLTLEFQAPAMNRAVASRLEWAIKQWPRADKEALIRGERPLPQLSDGVE
ncbi:GIY-YIG nuclease family protein [Marinobacter sp. CHS3-4]|uniref:GIY-YIG nuclease family protein n=1 Tax=Marinobacter sp. CHS3-4 TaxID=3045174 RepID=UPI0024B5DE44|nr:GIY-YIG nuclease family protein [Marinobacter sp. CHS3-4]MDI9244816.1 GIY-YIG nuclease family protein [Marinobacter sp. CHS3-4]